MFAGARSYNDSSEAMASSRRLVNGTRGVHRLYVPGTLPAHEKRGGCRSVPNVS